MSAPGTPAKRAETHVRILRTKLENARANERRASEVRKAAEVELVNAIAYCRALGGTVPP